MGEAGKRLSAIVSETCRTTHSMLSKVRFESSGRSLNFVDFVNGGAPAGCALGWARLRVSRRLSLSSTMGHTTVFATVTNSVHVVDRQRGRLTAVVVLLAVPTLKPPLACPP